MIKDVGDLLLAGLGEDVGGAAAASLHPHVEGRVDGVGEAAVGLVQLQRRDPEVEEHPLRLRHSEIGQDLGDRVVHRVHQPYPRTEGCEPASGELEGLRIPVDAHDRRLRAAFQQRLGVAAHAQGGVDDDRSGLEERRRQ
jgi:hypothetical protein